MKKYLTFCLLFLLPGFFYGRICDRLPADTIKHRTEDLIAPIEAQDTSVSIQDTAYFQRVEKKFSKKKWTKTLYDLVIDVPNPESDQADYSIEHTYQPYKGREITDIEIVTLPAFGTDVNQPDSMDNSWWVRSANKLYLRTQDRLIQKNLFFKKHDAIDPLVFSETEVFLRNIGFVHDVRIIIDTLDMPNNQAKVTVITRDRYPIAFSLHSISGHSVDFEVFNKNFARSGSELYLRGIYDHNYSPKLGYGVESKYNNIAKSFVNIQGMYLDKLTEKNIYAAVERPLQVTFKDYGKVSYEQTECRLNNSAWDSITPPYYNAFSAAWGYAFRLTPSETSMFFSVAGSYLNYRSSFVRVDTLPVPLYYEYASRQTMLLQFNLYRQRYYRQSMVHSFGIIENIPHGFLITGQAGYDMIPNYYYAPYFSLGFGGGQQFSFANINIYSAIGTHARNRSFENGVFVTDVYIFTPLLKLKKTRFRHFINVNFAIPLGRDNGLPDYADFKTYSNMKISPLNDIKGTKRLVLNVESDFFTPIQLIGFRMVAFAFFDGGWVSPQKKLLLNENFCWGAGLGIRLRNDLLVFKTLVLKVGVYPTVHQNLGDYFNVMTSVPQTTPNFLPPLPQVIQIN